MLNYLSHSHHKCSRHNKLRIPSRMAVYNLVAPLSIAANSIPSISVQAA
jgi:hypothetical protein